jgi:hypothetical protein
MGALVSFLGIKLNNRPAVEKNQDLIKQIKLKLSRIIN